MESAPQNTKPQPSAPARTHAKNLQRIFIYVGGFSLSAYFFPWAFERTVEMHITRANIIEGFVAAGLYILIGWWQGTRMVLVHTGLISICVSPLVMYLIDNEKSFSDLPHFRIVLLYCMLLIYGIGFAFSYLAHSRDFMGDQIDGGK